MTTPYYPAPPPANVAVPTGLAMKRRNEFLVWFVWPVLTLGIYHFVWYYKIHREMAEFDRRRVVPTSGPVLVLLFLGWLAIPALVSYWNTGIRIDNAMRAANAGRCSPEAGMFLMLLFGLGTVYYQAKLNRIADAYRVPAGTPVQLVA